MLDRPPSALDEVGGLTFFRTRCEGDYSALTLPRTFFGRSLIEKASFANTDLSESVLCWNDFVDVNFEGASLSGADLRAAVFTRCRFAGADLRKADLRGARLVKCVVDGALVDGAVVEIEAQWLELLTEQQLAGMKVDDEPGEEPPGG